MATSRRLRRRVAFAGLVALAASMPLAAEEGCAAPPALVELVRAAKDDRKSVTFFVGGQKIPVVVLELSPACTVQARNADYERIVIRLDRVDAAARH